MGAAILFGTVAVTFTVGMGATLGQVMKAKAHAAADVVVPAPLPDFGPQGPGSPGVSGPEKQSKADPVAVAAAIESAEGTRNHYRAATVRATVSGGPGSKSASVAGADRVEISKRARSRDPGYASSVSPASWSTA